MAGVGTHEPIDQLEPATLDRHRAISSLMEELEAVDWYDQRIDAASDPDLRTILTHNRDEEKEHAAMVIEWLRRHDETFAAELRDWVFTERPFQTTDHATEPEGEPSEVASGDGSLGIGSLKE